MGTSPADPSVPVVNPRSGNPSPARRRFSYLTMLLSLVYILFFSPMFLSLLEPSPFPKVENPERHLPLATMSPTPNWQEVAHLSGRSVQSTPPFLISGSRWRVRWHLTRRQGISEGLLKIRIYREDKGDYDMFADASDGGGEFIIYGAGHNAIGVFSHHDYMVRIDDLR